MTYLGSCAQADQISGGVGSAIGSIIGVPGLGQLFSGIASLFGPSAHYTPSGMLYDQAAQILKSQATELANLQNELFQKVGNPKRVPVPSWSYTSADDSKTGPYIAMILNDPQYARDTSPAPLIQDQADGVYDAVIQIQRSMIYAIETALNGIMDGTLVISAGKVLPAGSAIANDANSNVAQNCGNYGNCSASDFLSQNSGYVLAGLGVLGLVVLLAKRR